MNNDTTCANNENGFDLGNIIEKIAKDTLKDSVFEDIIRANIKEAIEKTVKKSFEYGALSKAITDKIEQYLVPYIEKYDLTALAPKLDTVLTGIVNETSVSDISITLNNFKKLMTIPDEKAVPLKNIFEAYCQYAAKNVETDDREVVYDNGEPEYESFECAVECEDISSRNSYFNKFSVDFCCDEEFELHAKNNFNITLSRWKDSKDEGYDIHIDAEPTISNLRYLSDFEILLMTLARAGVKVTDVEYMSDIVTPEKEPELTYQ